MDYDVIVVGGRCAGAGVAAFLAREGARVLVLEQARLPSDQVLSTHAVRPRGMDVLDALGVGNQVRTAPATRVLRLRKNAAFVDTRYPEGRTEHAPRRLRLDALLASAARSAGAELEDNARVRGLTWDGARVTGVRVRMGGNEQTLRAGLVIGADGRHSLVAREVRAQEYLGYSAVRGMYWSYWDTPQFFHTQYAFDMYFAHVGREMRILYPTDEGRLLVGYLPRNEQLPEFRADPEGALTRALAADEWTGPVVRERPPSERIRAASKERYFFREASGPGWMLLGDAGIHKEFVTGDGITEALLQAQTAAAAILTGKEGARERWWRERDVAALELYCFGRDQGTDGAAEELDELLFAGISGDAALADRLALGLDHQISPYDSLPITSVLGVLGKAALRGKFGVFSEFFARGKRRSQVKGELRYRKRLLADCSM